MRGRGRVLAGVLASTAAIVTIAVTTASGQEGAKPLTLSVGLHAGSRQREPDGRRDRRGVRVRGTSSTRRSPTSRRRTSHRSPASRESWTASADKKTWTYKLRPNLKWSDGQPLTSEDVAYTINRARKEEWLNYSQTVANVTATTPDPQTVVLKSSVADPKLPVMDVYILPKHVWSKYDKDALAQVRRRSRASARARTCSTAWRRASSGPLKANPNYWKGKPRIDRVVFRKFNNGDAMVAALRKGSSTPCTSCRATPSSAAQGRRDRDDRGSAGRLRRARAERRRGPQEAASGAARPARARGDRPRDRQEDDRRPRAARPRRRPPTRSARPRTRRGCRSSPPTSASTSTSPRPSGSSTRPATRTRTATASARCPAAASRAPALRRSLASRTIAQPIAEFITGWLKDIGIATTQKTYSDSQLTEVIGKGDYDLFVWGWTPFVDPDPMMSYFTCDQVSQDPKNPTNYYNDANWCDKTYERAVQAAEHRARPGEAQADRPADAHALLRVGHVCRRSDYEADLQAYRTDKYTGWIRQPAETGPVLFNNSSQTYANLKPVPGVLGVRRRRRRLGHASSRSSSRRSSCSAASGPVLLAAAQRRRARVTRGVTARFVTGKVLGSLATLFFVICFNFFLFRVVEGDPVASLFRGRNLTDAQREALTKQFGLDGSTGEQFVQLPAADGAPQPRPLVHDEPAGRDGDRRQGGPDDRARRHLDAAVDGLRRADRHLRGLAAKNEDRLRGDDVHDGDVLDAGLLARHAAAVAVRGDARLVPRRRDRGRVVERDRHRARRRPGPAHVPAVPDAHARLPRRVRARHALVAARHDARGLPRARAREGVARGRSCATATRCRMRCCRSSR